MNNDPLEIERAVLGAMILDNHARIVVMDILPTAECFADNAHRIVYSTIVKMSTSMVQVDLISIVQTLKKDGTIEKVGGAKAVAQLATKIASTAHVEMHSRYLLEKYIRIQVNQVLSDSIQKSINDQDDIFEVTEYIQKEISGILTNSMKSTDINMEQRIQIERQNRALAKESGMNGISTGSKVLDEFTGGFVPSDLWIVGGRPGSGKTSWMVSTLMDLALRGVSVGVISIEMSGAQLTQRMISNFSGVEAIKLRKSNSLTPDDIKRLPHFESQIARLPIYIDDPASVRSQSIRTKAHIWKRKYGIQILFVDFLQKITGTPINGKFGSRDQEMGEVSATLKTIAKELNIPVVCLASLNRDVEKRGDKIPQLSDLRESGNIESDADQVLFLMRPEYYGLTGKFLVENDEYPVDGLAVGSLAKNRHGSVGEIAFKFQKQIMRFSDYYGETIEIQATPTEDVF